MLRKEHVEKTPHHHCKIDRKYRNDSAMNPLHALPVAPQKDASEGGYQGLVDPEDVGGMIEQEGHQPIGLDHESCVQQVDRLRRVGEVQDPDQPEEPEEALLGAGGRAPILAPALDAPPVRSVEFGHGLSLTPLNRGAPGRKYRQRPDELAPDLTAPEPDASVRAT